MSTHISTISQVRIKPQAPPQVGNVNNRKAPVDSKAVNSIENTIEMLNASLRTNDSLSEKIMKYM